MAGGVGMFRPRPSELFSIAILPAPSRSYLCTQYPVLNPVVLPVFRAREAGSPINLLRSWKACRVSAVDPLVNEQLV